MNININDDDDGTTVGNNSKLIKDSELFTDYKINGVSIRMLYPYQIREEIRKRSLDDHDIKGISKMDKYDSLMLLINLMDKDSLEDIDYCTRDRNHSLNLIKNTLLPTSLIPPSPLHNDIIQISKEIENQLFLKLYDHNVKLYREISKDIQLIDDDTKIKIISKKLSPLEFISSFIKNENENTNSNSLSDNDNNDDDDLSSSSSSSSDSDSSDYISDENR